MRTSHAATRIFKSLAADSVTTAYSKGQVSTVTIRHALRRVDPAGRGMDRGLFVGSSISVARVSSLSKIAVGAALILLFPGASCPEAAYGLE